MLSYKHIDAEEKSAGGIIIPDTAKESPHRARSLLLARAVGRSGAYPNRHEVGNRVLFGKWSGTEVKIDGQDS